MPSYPNIYQLRELRKLMYESIAPDGDDTLWAIFHAIDELNDNVEALFDKINAMGPQEQ